MKKIYLIMIACICFFCTGCESFSEWTAEKEAIYDEITNQDYWGYDKASKEHPATHIYKYTLYDYEGGRKTTFYVELHKSGGHSVTRLKTVATSKGSGGNFDRENDVELNMAMDYLKEYDHGSSKVDMAVRLMPEEEETNE